ncbi:uncharacterized protein LOC121441569 [Microtus oregoni]|uniref:uncharacterized protein LOC121441569 n=1 Tax=Microtus oregoni TaxID=111838 RepID=UPI001BB22E8F|nr:uncharacterized protein LOC121441569 [Microtus oregoni]
MAELLVTLNQLCLFAAEWWDALDVGSTSLQFQNGECTISATLGPPALRLKPISNWVYQTTCFTVTLSAVVHCGLSVDAGQNLVDQTVMRQTLRTFTLKLEQCCGNGLIVEEGQRCHRFACNTCPYVHNITRKVTNRKYPKLKEVDDVLGGAAAWENVDSTAEPCPKCEHPRAYFMQLQTRSADEPMTTFYKCCNAQCRHRWRD